MNFSIKFLIAFLLQILIPQLGNATKCVNVDLNKYIQNQDAFILAKVVDVKLENDKVHYEIHKIRNLKGKITKDTFSFSHEDMAGVIGYNRLNTKKEYIFALNKKHENFVPDFKGLCDPVSGLSVLDFFKLSDELETVTNSAFATKIAKLYVEEFLPSKETKALNYNAKLENENWVVTAETQCSKFLNLFNDCRIYNSKIIINKYGKILSFTHRRVFN